MNEFVPHKYGRKNGARAILFLALAGLAGAEQPIAYSHKVHIDQGLVCLDCHITADVSARATIPSVTKCMLCHAKIATDKPEIKKVAQYAASKREIPWERVYGFESGAAVKFQHAPHIRASVQCATCHGDMTQAATAQVLVKHTMGTCLSCHRQNHASEDCATCHY
jgi:Cytochrome c7 and related cytochrome c